MRLRNVASDEKLRVYSLLFLISGFPMRARIFSASIMERIIVAARLKKISPLFGLGKTSTEKIIAAPSETTKIKCTKTPVRVKLHSERFADSIRASCQQNTPKTINVAAPASANRGMSMPSKRYRPNTTAPTAKKMAPTSSRTNEKICICYQLRVDAGQGNCR